MAMKVYKRGDHVKLEVAILFLLTMAWQPWAVQRDTEILKEVIEDLNQEYDFELILWINLNGSTSSPEHMHHNEILSEIVQPKMIISKPDLKIRNLYSNFNMNVLTVARMNSLNQNITLNVMEQLLWKRHFTNIVVVFEAKNLSNNTEYSYLLNLFQEVRRRGFTSLMVLWHNKAYTYKPFGKMEVKLLKHYSDFKNKTLLKNFQMEEFSVAVTDHPPRSFSYYNPRGQLIRTGYYYKLLEHFMQHYNGTIQHKFVDLWKITNLTEFHGYDFVTNQPLPDEDVYVSSDVFYFSKYQLMVPTSSEIDDSLYLVVSFAKEMWFVILITFILTIVLIFAIPTHRSYHRRRNISRIVLQSINIIIFIPNTRLMTNHKVLLHFVLCLVFFFTGFSFTNLYTCNLSSIFASRLYEPQLEEIQDIARTNLKILLHTGEIASLLAIKNLPPIFYERCIANNNTAVHVERMKLNMSQMYVARDDVANMLVYQQSYLKRPRAKAIAEPVLGSHMSFMLNHRSRYNEQLNRYLGYVKDTGLFEKFFSDSLWDAFLGGAIQFFRDDELHIPLSVAYFRYAFVIWFVGLSCASIRFLWEFYQWKGRKLYFWK